MNIIVRHAEMTHSKADGYVGKVIFEVEGHKHAYEITLHSKSAKDWAYGLFYSDESGSEEDLFAVEDYLEENDEAYLALVQAARDALEPSKPE